MLRIVHKCWWSWFGWRDSEHVNEIKYLNTCLPFLFQDQLRDLMFHFASQDKIARLKTEHIPSWHQGICYRLRFCVPPPLLFVLRHGIFPQDSGWWDVSGQGGAMQEFLGRTFGPFWKRICTLWRGFVCFGKARRALARKFFDLLPPRKSFK